ncbi:MAG: CRISPR-associated endonuclease Cas2, partial [Blastocatellia bacterium]|nr:CRISPR-associated endonuclease Cas2 [Blastocatellia bacterium]
GKTQWTILQDRLINEINKDEDSIRFYFLDSDISIEHYGTKKPINLEEPLIL